MLKNTFTAIIVMDGGSQDFKKYGKDYYHNRCRDIGFISRLLCTDDMLAISPDDAELIKEFIRVIFGPDMEPQRTLPGLEGLQMVGQWITTFSGTVIAAMSGRQVIQLMCKKEVRKFVSNPG